MSRFFSSKHLDSKTLKAYTLENSRKVRAGNMGDIEAMVIALVSGSRGLGSKLTESMCCVLGRNNLFSQCVAHPLNGYRRIIRKPDEMLGRNLTID